MNQSESVSIKINIHDHLPEERLMQQWSEEVQTAIQARKLQRQSALWIPIEKAYQKAELVISGCLKDDLTPGRAYQMALLFDKTMQDYQQAADQDDYSSPEWTFFYKAWTHGFAMLHQKTWPAWYDKNHFEDHALELGFQMDKESLESSEKVINQKGLKHIEYWLSNRCPIEHVQTFLAYPTLSLMVGAIRSDQWTASLMDPRDTKSQLVRSDRFAEMLSAWEAHARKERGPDYAYEPRKGWLPLAEELGRALIKTSTGQELLVDFSARMNRKVDNERSRFMTIHPFDGALVSLSLVQALWKAAIKGSPRLLLQADPKSRYVVQNFMEAIDRLIKEFPLGYEGIDRAEANLAVMIQDAPVNPTLLQWMAQKMHQEEMRLERVSRIVSSKRSSS